MSKKAQNTVVIIRQCVGIDISKDTFTACLSYKTLEDDCVKVSTKTFTNNLKGFSSLVEWVNKLAKPEISILYVMEATGVYYENLAYYLTEHELSVSVQLAKSVKMYMQSHNIKSKTDDIDSQAIAQMGLERKLSLWVVVSPVLRTIKLLCRERVMLQDEQTSVKNRLHALKHSYGINQESLERYEIRLKLIAKQIKEIESEIRAMVDADDKLKERVNHVCTIKGFGFISAIQIIAETNGFANFSNQRQLISYAGYDMVRKQSGNSESKTRISKKGNKYIRKALYFPATSAAQHDPKMKKICEKVTDNTKIKMKGNVAVQRKMLILIYTIFTKNVPYNENYHHVKEPNQTQTQIKKVESNTLALPNVHEQYRSAS
jgi:transposase